MTTPLTATTFLKRIVCTCTYLVISGRYITLFDKNLVKHRISPTHEQITHLSRNELTVKEETYVCKFTFCSDWKFAALMIGIKAANSTFFCPWCLFAKEYRSAFNVDWEEVNCFLARLFISSSH